MERLNEDCILTLLSYLNIGAILAFGATNVRHHQIVTNYINRLAASGTINFHLQCTQIALREILQRFGINFIHLDAHIGEDIINMDIFEDIDGCLTPNIHTLILRTSMTEPNPQLILVDDVHNAFSTYDFEDSINEQQVKDNLQQMLYQFQRNSQIVIDSINSNTIPNLRNMSFIFELDFSEPTYFFLTDSILLNAVNPIVFLLFSSLHRGNLHFVHVFESHTVQLILTFNL